MVFGWRKAFCTSIPKETDHHDSGGGGSITPKSSGSRFAFFSSNPSTPRLPSKSNSTDNLSCHINNKLPERSASVPVSPRLNCKTSNNSPFQWSSTPSSPRSPSPFSLIKSNLRISTTTNKRCGLCLQSVKRGKGVAIYTAECEHVFHFPCVADYVKKKGSLACPICNSIWKEIPILSVNRHEIPPPAAAAAKESAVNDVEKKSKLRKQNSFLLKVYDDDEPLISSSIPKARFNPIPESDESCDDDDQHQFQGFHTNIININNKNCNEIDGREIAVRLLPEVAVVSSDRNNETYAVVLKLIPPAVVVEKPQNRAPIDLVAVIDVSEKSSIENLRKMKRIMKLIISSLSSNDRLSIVAFSSYSKRLLPLKRMSSNGQRAARRIVDAMVVLEGSSSSQDAVKKAAKVLEDRREKNSVASIVVISDFVSQTVQVASTRYSHAHLDIAVHTVNIAETEDHSLGRSVTSLLHVPVHDLQVKLGFVSGSGHAEIAGVYGYSPRSVYLGSGTVRVGEMCMNEERELLVELKVPFSAVGAHTPTVLSVCCSYRESVTQEVINCKEYALVVPRVHTVRSSSVTIQRLRNLFITTRALAESRRLTARNDLIGAYHMLISARAILHQTSSTCSEFVVSIEAELNELQRRRQARVETAVAAAYVDDKGEPLTPTSAWRVAEKLAKVAIMRKSLNRVSDLHGFEDARF
uniref:probable E3 ubiquitin-protein ligase EDA40 n=1 Tax=Erigeron canadensis TaxID=72917 RepID=UPI001CB8EAB6|nr:probable E3 ubiquitin-protein ligase EDA40 [Erigeron canadensis]